MKFTENDLKKSIFGKAKGLNILALLLSMFLIGFFTQFVASYALTLVLNMIPEVAKEYEAAISNIIQFSPLIIFYVVILAPILEELIFRSLICGLLKKFVPFFIANITQALAFAIYHGNIVQGVYAFILGLFIGFLLYISGSVIYTMAFHMGINLCGMLLDKIVPEKTNEAVKLLVAAVSLGLVIFLIIKCRKRILCEEN